MKVVGSTCALKSKVGGEDMVRCLSEQSLAISKCKIPLLDEQMSVFLQDMNSCYSKLKELVPTLPTNKKASKVEILQHVIDYIWDLQVELDEPEKSRHQPGGVQPRTPLTALNAELASIAVEVIMRSRSRFRLTSKRLRVVACVLIVGLPFCRMAARMTGSCAAKSLAERLELRRGFPQGVPAAASTKTF